MISTVRRLANADAVVLGAHAISESMRDDDVTFDDVRHLLANADEVIAEDDTGLKWKVYGRLVNGADYAVVVNVHADHLYVITCHNPP
ncbi:MAG: DUF4258 domain-containing protein [Deltaproteobacteria bacterium]|nr:DUF4258 domain-containing protein [Deltaproteobacteria bacterium]